jgi:hypothetical protein
MKSKGKLDLALKQKFTRVPITINIEICSISNILFTRVPITINIEICSIHKGTYIFIHKYQHMIFLSTNMIFKNHFKIKVYKSFQLQECLLKKFVNFIDLVVVLVDSIDFVVVPI